MFSNTSFKMSKDIQQISPPPVGGDEGEGGNDLSTLKFITFPPPPSSSPIKGGGRHTVGFRLLEPVF